MAISREEVEKTAFIARLELSEAEKQMFTEQLNAVLDYAAMLERLDTEQVEPTVYALSLQNVLREDSLGEEFEREKLLQIAPDGDNGFFKVPKII